MKMKTRKFEYYCPNCNFKSVFLSPQKLYHCASCNGVIGHLDKCKGCGFELSPKGVHANCCDEQIYWEKIGVLTPTEPAN
jgi:hypothetical protein